MADVTKLRGVTSQDRVPVARSVRMRRLRVRAIPALCLLATAVAWLALWNVQAQSVNGVGRVSTLRIDITSPASGMIARMPHQTGLQWSLFDHVREGDVIAEYDDSEYQADKALFAHDSKLLQKELTAWREYFAKDDDPGLAEQIKKLEAEEIAQVAAIASQVEQGAAAERVTQEQPIGQGLLSNDLPAAAREHFTELRNDRQLLAIRALQLRNQANTLLVRAPISGTLVDVYCSPGQRLHAGAPIATLAADYGSYIVSYLPEATRFEPLPGMRVTLRGRAVGAKAVDSEIEEVGRQIALVPTSLATNPSIPERGLPVRISLPAEIDLQPGVLVDIVYHTNETM
jgi:multidrug resistance efflux pump